MNPQLTDELIETLKGIKEGKEWEYLYEGQWKKPTILNVWDCLGKDWLIRLKPFVPEPPLGYRLLTAEEKKGQWIEGAYYWSHTQWLKRTSNLHAGEGCSANKMDHIAVPIEPPAPEYVPWTFETGPRDRLVWVHKKGYFTDRLIIAWRDNGVEIGHYGENVTVMYQDLFDNWLLQKNEPCGTIKQ